MMARRWLYTGAAGVVFVIALGWAFAPRPVQVEAARATTGPFETVIEEDGKTRLFDLYVVSAPLAGMVGRIGLREGDAVLAGTVVASLRPTYAPLLDERSRREQQARLAAAQARVQAAVATVGRAEAAMQRARHEAMRTEQLARDGFVAPSRLESDRIAAIAAQKEHDSALAQRQIALHEVVQASAALEASERPEQSSARQFQIRAPIDGTVLRVVQTSEAVVALGAPLIELGDPRKLEVVSELLTPDALRARPGSPVRIDRWGGPVLQGRVRKIEPAAFTKISALGVEEQRVRVLIDLIDAADKAKPLGVNYRVNVMIITSHEDRVTKVPVSAVFPLPGKRGEAADGMGVYTIRNGRAQLTPVTIGGRNALEAWILQGVADGTSVVLYPSNKVRDGARVAVRDVARPM